MVRATFRQPNQRQSSIYLKKIQLLLPVKAFHYMQSNSRVNNSQVNNSRVNISRLNISRLNISHHRKTKKPFTQPAAGSSEHLCSSERLDRGGWGSSRVASSIYIYIYSPLKKLLTQGPLRGLPVNLRFTQGALLPHQDYTYCVPYPI